MGFRQQNLTSDNEFAKAFFGPPRLAGLTFTTINNRYKIIRRLVTGKSKDKNGININIRCSKSCPKGTNAFMRIGVFSEEMVLCPPY